MPNHGNGSRGRSGPVDPRLLGSTRGTRHYLVLAVVVGGATACLVLLQAWLIATTVASVVEDHTSAGGVRTPLVLLAGVILARAALAWGGERAAERASAAAKSHLRTALTERIAELGPYGIDRDDLGRLVVLATNGIDALDSYFARYLPQLFLAVMVPLSVVIVVLRSDWLSAVMIAVTVPLIPLFMSLVGAATGSRIAHQRALLDRLSGHFLDMVAGLPTLKVFGRAKAQAAAVRDITDRYRAATVSTLRIAFLSSLVLELLATISVALVAVEVGLRLLGGHLSFEGALFILILAPEAYLPLRQLGMNYHASAEGLHAAEEVFALLERPTAARGTRLDMPDPSLATISVRDLEVRYEGRKNAALPRTALTVEAGEVLALTGPSGCGKSTLLGVLLLMVPTWTGSVDIGGVDLRELDPDAWRDRIAWVPQRPHLFARSIADNVRLGRPDASDDRVRSAIAEAGLEETVRRLPDGLSTVLGSQGAGLSAGERQRVALARAFLRDSSLLLLDEPTARLDGRTEEGVLAAVKRLVAGRTVVMAAHRPTLVEMADRTVSLGAPLMEAR